MFYNNGRLPNSQPNFKFYTHNINSDRNNIDNILPSTSNMPNSADNNLNYEMREFYNFFLNLPNKHSAFDLINTYFRINNSQNFDKFY